MKYDIHNAVLGFALGAIFVNGLWLVTQTTYPYARTVGGGSLLAGVIFAGFAVALGRENR